MFAQTGLEQGYWCLCGGGWGGRCGGLARPDPGCFHSPTIISVSVPIFPSAQRTVMGGAYGDYTEVLLLSFLLKPL